MLWKLERIARVWVAWKEEGSIHQITLFNMTNLIYVEIDNARWKHGCDSIELTLVLKKQDIYIDTMENGSFRVFLFPNVFKKC